MWQKGVLERGAALPQQRQRGVSLSAAKEHVGMFTALCCLPCASINSINSHSC